MVKQLRHCVHDGQQQHQDGGCYSQDMRGIRGRDRLAQRCLKELCSGREGRLGLQREGGRPASFSDKRKI